MIIDYIVLENFGLYKGKHSIIFPDSSDKRITLIGGLNGRGKTTILESIFIALYGRRAKEFLNSERISYSEYLYNYINKSSLDQSTSITLAFRLDAEGKEIITIQRTWIAESNSVRESFYVLKNGIKDQYLTDHWDYYMEDILPLSISRFFFFDGEKITEIANDDNYEAVKDSIRSLLGINTVNRLRDDMNKLMKRLSNVSSSQEPDINTRLMQINIEIDETEEMLKSSIAQKGKLNQELGVKKNKYDVLENKFWEMGGHFGLNREEIIAKRDELVKEIAQKKEEVTYQLELASTPLLMCRPLLERTYNQIKKDEQVRLAKYSSVVIEKMKELLGNLYHEDSKKELILEFLMKARNELTVDDTVQNTQQISPTSILMIESILEQSAAKLDDINRLLKQLQLMEKESLELDLHLDFHVENNEIKDIWKKMRALSGSIMKLETEIAVLEENQQMLMRKISQLENKRSEALKAIKQNEKAMDEKARVIRYASLAMDVMEKFKKRLQKRRIKELESAIYDCFKFMSYKESMVKEIKINPETLDIKLVDFKGGELLKSQLSAGEQQIFAVSVLWGLAKCSGYQMPVIVDTPLGRLDSHHRKNFVTRYLPHASHQVIVLSTDEEINGEYYEYMKPCVNGVFLLEYNDEEKSTTIKPGYFGGEQ